MKAGPAMWFGKKIVLKNLFREVINTINLNI